MAKERRKNERQKVTVEADIRSKDGGYRAVVSSRDLSSGGAYFVTQDPPNIGDLLEVQTGSGLVFTAEVLRVAKHFDGEFGFAVKFITPADARRKPEADSEDRVDPPRPRRDRKHVYELQLKDFNQDAFSYYRPLSRVQEYVDEHYFEEISLEKAASQAAMEKTYFSFFFRQKVGVTFSSWLQYLRVAKAMSMMESMDYSITEVAYAVGFQELSTFQKAFKKWTHLTPREFKKLARPA